MSAAWEWSAQAAKLCDQACTSVHPRMPGLSELSVQLAVPQIWKEIMTDVAQDPVVSANVIFDILNEPDSYGLTWDGTQLDGQGLGYWYHQVMAMGYSINPGAFPQPRLLLTSCHIQR